MSLREPLIEVMQCLISVQKINVWRNGTHTHTSTAQGLESSNQTEAKDSLPTILPGVHGYWTHDHGLARAGGGRHCAAAPMVHDERAPGEECAVGRPLHEQDLAPYARDVLFWFSPRTLVGNLESLPKGDNQPLVNFKGHPSWCSPSLGKGALATQEATCLSVCTCLNHIRCNNLHFHPNMGTWPS